MNTATVTWIYHKNFGTFLQAYALQKSIIDLGHNNVIIDDSTFHRPSLYKRLKIRAINFIKGRSNKSQRLYRRFANANLNIAPWDGNTNRIANKYDVFLCGSDQIWSPLIEFNPYYFLGFTDKKKVAYAPSTGTNISSDEYIANTKSLIERFSHVAVREEDGARMLSAFVNKEIKVVIDPTLLLTQKEWKKVESRVDTDEPYILCYFLTPNKWYMDYVKQYAQQHHCKVKIFNTKPIYNELGFELIDAGPGEFISYIKNADKVFTDSFHSSIFSILYHKDFITFKRFKESEKQNQNARIANLFEKLGLTKRFIGEEEIATIETIEKTNYDRIEDILKELRATSKEYLRNAIEN